MSPRRNIGKAQNHALKYFRTYKTLFDSLNRSTKSAIGIVRRKRIIFKHSEVDAVAVTETSLLR